MTWEKVREASRPRPLVAGLRSDSPVHEPPGGDQHEDPQHDQHADHHHQLSTIFRGEICAGNHANALLIRIPQLVLAELADPPPTEIDQCADSDAPAALFTLDGALALGGHLAGVAFGAEIPAAVFKSFVATDVRATFEADLGDHLDRLRVTQCRGTGGRFVGQIHTSTLLRAELVLETDARGLPFVGWPKHAPAIRADKFRRH